MIILENNKNNLKKKGKIKRNKNNMNNWICTRIYKEKLNKN